MNNIQLLEKIVAIPSFVDDTNNENELGEFLMEILRTNTPLLPQKILTGINGRFNIFAGNPSPEILFVGHIDTIQPQSGWTTNPYRLVRKNNRLYGLGTADMKGSIASFLTALTVMEKTVDPGKIGLLLYIDEEYDFLGMKSFINQSKKISPKVIISLDGKLEVASGCRGCVEINFELQGLSGHSAKPFKGINAITSALKLYEILDRFINKFVDQELGPSTSNIAYIRGGNTYKENNQLTWRREGNIIADFTDLTLEFRVSQNLLDADRIISQIQVISQALGVKTDNFTIRHDLKPWPSNYNSSQLEVISDIYKNSSVNFKLANRYYSGYLDLAMLTKITKSPMFVIGAGGENTHTANEYTQIKSLDCSQRIYEQLFQKFCTK